MLLVEAAGVEPFASFVCCKLLITRSEESAKNARMPNRSYSYRTVEEIAVKVDWPIFTNIRLDPFERTGMPSGDKGSLAYYNWFAYQFWRFAYVQQQVEKLAQTALEFPPMQKGGSFNLEVIKEQIARKMAAQNQ
jgi:hypothetical protein